MIQSSTQVMKSRLQGGAEKFMRAGIVTSFISLLLKTRSGLRGATILGT